VLPIDQRIRIVRRLVRGQYIDCDESFRPISSLTLDRSYNEKLKESLPNMPNCVGKLYKEMLHIVSAGQLEETVRNENCNSSLNENKDIKLQLEKQQEFSDETGASDTTDNTILDKGKRKRDSSNSEQSPEMSIISTKVKIKCNSEWKTELETLLSNCIEARQRRRADVNALSIQETALRTAISAREHFNASQNSIIPIAATGGETTTEQLLNIMVNDISEILDCTKERLSEYLNGNTKNLLSLQMLSTLTGQLQQWMSTGAD
jgi:hypothetical protein